jgi:RimJ/RimL family protein N-acetyltransferase
MRPEIKGEKIILRKYEMGFANMLAEAAIESRGGEFTRWMPWCHLNYELADSKSFIEKLEECWNDQTIFGFGIFDLRTERFLGGIGLNQPNEFHNFYNLGYWVRVSEQNRGIVSTAICRSTASKC